MAPNGVNSHVNGFDEDEIDYSDIEAKCVQMTIQFLLSPTHLSCARYLTNTRYQVQYDDGLDNVVVVDGVPVIDKSKVDKLLARIAKEFSKKGSPVKVDDMFIPWDEKTGKSKG